MKGIEIKNYFLCTLLCLCATVEVFAVSAFPGLIDIRQPDGYIIKGRMMGDEHFHWVESEDGYTLLYNEKHFLTLALPDSKGDLQPSKFIFRKERDRDGGLVYELKRIKKHAQFSQAQKELMASRRRSADINRVVKPVNPVVGDRKFLVVMIEFPDKPFVHTQQEFDALMNEVGYTANGNQGSVRDFYYENSFGQLNLVSDVAGVYQAKHEMAYYGNNTNGNAQALAIEAMAAAAADFDLSQYDSDGDGFIDGLHIIFSGYGEEAGGGDDCIWSHECTTSGVFCTYDGVKMNAYSCTPELQGNAGSSMSYIGVICHEIGHALGTPDFYDTNYATNGQYGGTGNWDVMGSGSWNGNGACPASFNPYSKIYDFQWSGVEDGNRAMSAKLNAKTKDNFIRIDTKTEGEYFLLEYRHQTGFDSRIPGHGLMVWRATDNLSRRDNNTLNANHKQQFYPVAANGTVAIPNSTPSSYGNTNMASTPFPGTNGVTELTDATTPSMKSWNGEPTDFPITNIVENTAGKYIEFDICGGDNGTAYGLEISNPTLTSLTATWKTPQPDMTVMLLSNTADVFGILENRSYAVGETLEDGGEVVYVGTDNEFTHTGLMEHTNYYYRICTWKEESSSWGVSSTQMGRTKTGIITTYPFFDDFNTQELDNVYEEEIIFGATNHWMVGHPNPNSTEWMLIFDPNEGFTHQQSRLSLPTMNLANSQCAFLSFDYHNWISSVKVFYRVSPQSRWSLLAELDNHYNENSSLLNTRSHFEIRLPDLSEEYQLCILGDFSPRGNTMRSDEKFALDNLKIYTDEPVVVITQGIKTIGTTSAIVAFSVIAGTEDVSETGVSYSSNLSSWTQVPCAVGECQLTGLGRNTWYYVRAYVKTNNGDYYYGDIKAFSTLSFNSGSGTKDDPILISTLSDWNLLRSTIAQGKDCEGLCFILTNSLSLSSNNLINGTFCGKLDGSGNTLSSTTSGINYIINKLGEKGEIFNINLSTGSLVIQNYGYIHDCVVNFAEDYSSTGSMDFGFIARRNYGTISNCHVYAQSLYSERGYIGGICGWNFNMVTLCSFNGTLLSNNNSHVGGIAGINYYSGKNYGIISQCINSGTIGVRLNAEDRAWWARSGGIAGGTYGTIDQCVNRGIVTAGCSSNEYDNTNGAGGIVARADHNVAVVSNCLHAGIVSTAYNLNHNSVNAGGIVGSGYLSNITNCISAGQVNSTTSISAYNHAVIGSNNQTGVKNCFYTGTTTDNYATELSDAQMKDESLVQKLNDYNGIAVWTTGENHPELLMENSNTCLILSNPTDITQTLGKIDGFAVAPNGSECYVEWKEEDATEWNRIETETGKNFSIILQGLTPAKLYEIRLSVLTDTGWEYSVTKSFATQFVSAGTTDDPILIPNLYALRVFRQTVHQGNQYDNQIIRLTSDINLNGDRDMLWEPITEGVNGAFAGEFDGNGHVIRNMKVISSAPAAGFFGTTYKCYIHDLTILDGDITSHVAPSTNSYLGGVGGILGDNISYEDDGRPLLERCSFTGTITGGNAIGGIAGNAERCRIIDCYAIANILDTQNSAFKAGITSSGIVENCYFSGRIATASQPSANYSRIIAILNTTTSYVSNCYYENSQISYASSYGTRLTETQMKDGTLLSKYSSNVWRSDNTATPINKGYPVLVSQSAPHVWIDYDISEDKIYAKGTFYGAERNYAVRGIEVCSNPNGENSYQVTCESANSFETTLPYSPGTYLQFRAYARDNESFTAYSDWAVIDGDKIVYPLGDVNGDGVVDVSDAVATIDVILQNLSGPLVLSNYDVNADGDVDVMDVTKIVSIILADNSSNAPRRAAMNRLAMENVQIKTVGNGFSVDIERPEQYTAFQFDVEVPEGMSVTDVMLADGKTKHNLHFAKKSLNTYTVVGLSYANELLPSTVKGLIDIRLSGIKSGDVNVKNIMFVNPKGEKTFYNNKSVLVGTTGINGVSTSTTSDGIYDLYGRKLNVERNQLRRGIYIVNGKKVIIK